MSKPIVITLPHELGQAEARRRIESGFGGLTKQFGDSAKMDSHWEGDRLQFAVTVMGQALSGHLDVLAEAVRMELTLPGMLGMIAGKIRDKLTKEGQLLLEKK